MPSTPPSPERPRCDQLARASRHSPSFRGGRLLPIQMRWERCSDVVQKRRGKRLPQFAGPDFILSRGVVSVSFGSSLAGLRGSGLLESGELFQVSHRDLIKMVFKETASAVQCSHTPRVGFVIRPALFMFVTAQPVRFVIIDWPPLLVEYSFPARSAKTGRPLLRSVRRISRGAGRRAGNRQHQICETGNCHNDPSPSSCILS